MTSPDKLRRKMFLKACLMSGCLFEAVGCPQIFGDALQSGFQTFLSVGLPSLLATTVDIDALVQGLMGP